MIQAPSERLEWHLLNWAAWMKASGMSKLDTPSRSPIIGVSHSADFDMLYDSVTAQTAEGIDGCVSSLVPAEQQALRCNYLGERWQQGASWRYNATLERVLVMAYGSLQLVINSRGIS